MNGSDFIHQSTVMMSVLCKECPQWTLWAPYGDPLQCCMCFYRDPKNVLQFLFIFARNLTRVQLGIQVYLLPSQPPWCMLSINCVYQCRKTRSFTGPHDVQECIGILYFPTWCAKYDIGPGPGTAFFSRLIFSVLNNS